MNLSHNKISFVTKKTFPSNPYIPYRLREVDLSYNMMPVLTHDITMGTKKVEVLNVSYNMINEIRKGEWSESRGRAGAMGHGGALQAVTAPAR